jgi:hypothetical protein
MSILGTGATLTKNAVSLGKLLSVSVDGSTVPAIDVTNMESTGKEYIAGTLVDDGTLSCEILTETALTKASLGGVAEAIVLTANAFSLSGTGFITSISTAIPLEDKVTQSLTIQLTV